MHWTIIPRMALICSTIYEERHAFTSACGSLFWRSYTSNGRQRLVFEACRTDQSDFLGTYSRYNGYLPLFLVPYLPNVKIGRSSSTYNVVKLRAGTMTLRAAQRPSPAGSHLAEQKRPFINIKLAYNDISQQP